MGMTALRRFAFARPRAFPVLGHGGVELWRAFLNAAPAALSRAPRDADLLVLAGEIPQPWSGRLAALFETLALPRLALWLHPPWDCPPPDVPLGVTVPHGQMDRIDWDDVTARLLDPKSPANRPLLPDQPPSPWRGRGDHGQGGEGMMGGKPYGRPMAMTMDDRDGLALDDVPTALGPHFPGLPSGLELELRMQGDRIRQVQVVHNRFPPRPHYTPQAVRYGGSGNGPVLRRLAGEAVKVADMERARLASHLGWLADFLEFAGLEALAQDIRWHRNMAEPRRIGPLLARAEGRLLRRLTQGTGVVDAEHAREMHFVGPLARACGLAADARSDDPAYQKLGFAPQVEVGGDVWARLRVRLGECRQSLELIRRGGHLAVSSAEGPRGAFGIDGQGTTPSRRHLPVLEAVLPGLEWYEAVLFIASLDLDMEEAALS